MKNITHLFLASVAFIVLGYTGFSLSALSAVPGLQTPAITVKTPSGCGGKIDIALKSLVPGAESYDLYFNSIASNRGLTKIATFTSTSTLWTYTHTVPKGNAYYYYKVQAKSSSDESLMSSFTSAFSSVSCTPDAPAAPTISVPPSGSCGTQISWKAMPLATKYALYRKVSSQNDSSYVLVKDVSGLSYVDPVQSGTYLYKVKAINNSDPNGALESTFSSPKVANVTSRGCPVPTVPYKPTIGLRNTSGSCGIDITWGATSGNATSYSVYRAPSGSGSYEKIKTVPSTSQASYAYHDLLEKTAGVTTWDYKIIASNDVGDSAPALGSISPTTYCDASGDPAIVPNAPSGFYANTSASCGYKIELQWYSSSGATGYKIYRDRSGSGSFGTLVADIATSSTGVLRYTDMLSSEVGVSPNVYYYYHIYAYNKYGNSALFGSSFTRPSNRCTQQPPVLTAPTGVKAQTSQQCGGKNDISWSSYASSTGFNVYRGTATSSSYSKIASVSATTTSFVDSAAVDTVYYYKISSNTPQGESLQSSIVSAKTSSACDPVPATPLELRVISPAQCRLEPYHFSWNKVSEAKKYYLYRIGANRVLHVVTETTSTSFDDYIPEDGFYSYYVTYKDKDGIESPASNRLTISKNTKLCFDDVYDKKDPGWDTSAYDIYADDYESSTFEGDDNGDGICSKGEACFPVLTESTLQDVLYDKGNTSHEEQIGEADAGIFGYALNGSSPLRYLRFFMDYDVAPVNQLPPDCFDGLSDAKDNDGMYIPYATSTRLVEDATTVFDPTGANKKTGLLIPLNPYQCKDLALKEKLFPFDKGEFLNDPYSDKAVSLENLVALTDENRATSFYNLGQNFVAPIYWADKYQYGLKTMLASVSGGVGQVLTGKYVDSATGQEIKTSGTLNVNFSAKNIKLTEQLIKERLGNSPHDEFYKTRIFKGELTGYVEISFPEISKGCGPDGFQGTMPLTITVDLNKTQKIASSNQTLPYDVRFDSPIRLNGSVLAKKTYDCGRFEPVTYDVPVNINTTIKTSSNQNLYQGKGQIGGYKYDMYMLKPNFMFDSFEADCPPPWNDQNGTLQCPLVTAYSYLNIKVAPDECYLYDIEGNGKGKFNKDCTFAGYSDPESLADEGKPSMLASVWGAVKGFLDVVGNFLTRIYNFLYA